MTLTLLFLALSFSSVQATENKILVKQSPMLVVDNNDVTLSCRYSHNLLLKEFRASLYKGVNSDVEVCVANGNLTSQLQFHSNVGFTCDGNLNNETVTFYLRNLHVNQTDIYFCRVEVMYPPPYLDNEKSNGTIIHVKEKHLCHDQTTPRLFWALVGAAGVLLCYGLLVTVALYIIWTNSRRNRLLQSDYMNMTPGDSGPHASITSPMLQRETSQPTVPDRDPYPEASRLVPLHLLNTTALDRKGLSHLQPATLDLSWATFANCFGVSRSNITNIWRLWNEFKELLWQVKFCMP